MSGHIGDVSKKRRPVVLAMCVLPADRDLETEREQEMRSLLDTAGCEVLGVVRQRMQRPWGATMVGKGKVTEIKAKVEEVGADEVVFDVDLTPSQQRNLEEVIGVNVADYTGLILHIFALGARSYQAMLAVEAAQLQYQRSRLKRLWTHLDRFKAGMNMRGPGEKQLESDRRLLDQRLQDLKQRLEEIEAQKELTLASRDKVFKVCLVGYTNAGKSTIMNALTHAGVLAEDRLFATLDTRTAKLVLDARSHIVLSDTVGFIRKLPTALVASFHTTLAEVVHADLLLHVVDASHSTMQQQIDAVEDVLTQIKAEHVPSIMVFNKIDQAHSRALTLAFRRRYQGSVMISALTGEGIDELRQSIRDVVAKGNKRLEIRYPIVDGATDAFLRRRASILEERYEDDLMVLTIEADERLHGELAANDRCKLTVIG